MQIGCTYEKIVEVSSPMSHDVTDYLSKSPEELLYIHAREFQSTSRIFLSSLYKPISKLITLHIPWRPIKPSLRDSSMMM